MVSIKHLKVGDTTYELHAAHADRADRDSADNIIASTYSKTTHNHDTSYYTKTQIDSMLLSTALETTWSASVKTLTWSRLCSVTHAKNKTGSSFILNIAGTRDNVIYNDTYLIKVDFPKHAVISKICGNGYTGWLQIRVLVNSSSDCIVEFWDNGGAIEQPLPQTVECSLLSIFCGNVQTCSEFTSGDTLPTDYVVGAWLLTNNNSLQGNLSWDEITDKPSTYSPAEHIHEDYAAKSALDWKMF